MNTRRPRFLLIGFLLSLLSVMMAAVFVFGGVGLRLARQRPDLSNFGPAQLDFRLTSFSALPGWRQDDQSAALGAFIRSCDAIEDHDDARAANLQELLGPRAPRVTLGGTIADWRGPCETARLISSQSYSDAYAERSAARIFFESQFAPIQILDWRAPRPDGPARRSPAVIDKTGLFTGYFEPIYEASAFRTARFSAPVYRRPDDLVEVDLGAFRDVLAGQRLAGRVEDGQLVPYADHREINAGALDGVSQAIAWLAPNDLFFLQIQGSGRLVISRERTLRVGYAAQNGRPYTAIGKVMADRAVMPLSEISMQSIRAWLDQAAPAEATAMREENASYVFFTGLDLGDDLELGPLGAQGVSLTPERSLAVDRRFHAMGAPVWVDIDPLDGDPKGPRFQRLMIAQDTGGAIRGPVRGDIFWGAGDRAGEVAGSMRGRGRMFVLVPRSVASRLGKARRL